MPPPPPARSSAYRAAPRSPRQRGGALPPPPRRAARAAPPPPHSSPATPLRACAGDCTPTPTPHPPHRPAARAARAGRRRRPAAAVPRPQLRPRRRRRLPTGSREESCRQSRAAVRCVPRRPRRRRRRRRHGWRFTLLRRSGVRGVILVSRTRWSALLGRGLLGPQAEEEVAFAGSLRIVRLQPLPQRRVGESRPRQRCFGGQRVHLRDCRRAPRLDRLSRVLSPPQAVDLVLEGELLLRERGEALHRGSRLCQHLCAGREALLLIDDRRVLLRHRELRLGVAAQRLRSARREGGAASRRGDGERTLDCRQQLELAVERPPQRRHRLLRLPVRLAHLAEHRAQDRKRLAERLRYARRRLTGRSRPRLVRCSGQRRPALA
mmetsp:Transcript_3686/g.10763  ORF Transcript_3686/g.10763 Transcript_3686/m.10763 type:complete len:379 (+) Transcript_3686:1595-2731(+)